MGTTQYPLATAQYLWGEEEVTVLSDKTIMGADSSFQQESSLSSARVQTKKTKNVNKYYFAKPQMSSKVTNVTQKGGAYRAVNKCHHSTDVKGKIISIESINFLVMSNLSAVK